MALLTVAEFRTHMKTALADAAVQRLLDDAEAEIDKRFGPLATETDAFAPGELQTSIWLTRKATAITEVKERIGDTDTTLAANDYELRRGRELIRRWDGTNGRREWGDLVLVTYTPVDDTANRKRVVIDLARLAAEYRAASSTELADYTMDHVDYERERTRILRRLRTRLLA